MISDEIKNIKNTKKDLRNFGLTIGIALLILAFFLYRYGKGAYPYILTTAVVFLISGALKPNILKPVHKSWMMLSIVLGWFSTRIILAFLFYGVFTPIGLISRLFGKRHLEVKQEKYRETYWHYRELRKGNKSDYERQF